MGVLELAKQLGNVSAACGVMGYSPDSFFRFKELLRQGRPGGAARIFRRKPGLKNRVAPEIEQAVSELALEQPALGQVLAAKELCKRGLSVSAVAAPRS